MTVDLSGSSTEKMGQKNRAKRCASTFSSAGFSSSSFDSLLQEPAVPAVPQVHSKTRTWSKDVSSRCQKFLDHVTCIWRKRNLPCSYTAMQCYANMKSQQCQDAFGGPSELESLALTGAVSEATLKDELCVTILIRQQAVKPGL